MQKKYEICLRLSQEEKTLLENSARCCGLSKTAYLRRLILGAEVRALPSQEIKALRTEIHHIGNNINQIAWFGSLISNGFGLFMRVIIEIDRIRFLCIEVCDITIQPEDTLHIRLTNNGP